MTYPNSNKQFIIKIDKSASGYATGPEYFNVPGIAPYEIYLDHVPKDSATTTVGASGGAAWTEVLVSPASAGQYLIDYDTGKVTFYSADANAAAQASYKCLGDDIMAEHINTLQEEVEGIEETLGENVQGAYSTLGARLDIIVADASASGVDGDRLADNTVRAGALMDDIKGVSWASIGRPTLQSNIEALAVHELDATGAHAASAISCIPPGSTTADNIQEHIDSIGGTIADDNNPHGLSLSDIWIGNEDLTTSGSLNASTNIRGGDVYGNYVFASGSAIFMNHHGPDSDQYMYFYNSSNVTDKFFRWSDSNNRFELNWDMYVYGGISASGYFIPTASGVGNVGSPAVPFASGNFDTVQATSFQTGGSTGANGFFTTNDGKTVTVVNGLVVSIV